MSQVVAERWKRWKGFILPPIVLLVVALAIGWRVWTPIKDARRAFAWDAQWQYWGDIAFQVDAWKHGELPLWDPYDRCGYPFAADPQTGVLYPVNWLLVVLGLLGGAKFWLVSVKTIFHIWWWALGAYVWLRRRGTPSVACYAAATFCMLAYPTNAWFSALNWGMAWAPWVLLAIDRWAEAPSPRSAAWVALAFGMGALAGSPPSFWYTLLLAVPYGSWALLHHAKATDRRAYGRAAASSAGLAAALFLVMVGGQMLATGALIPHTVRAVRNLDFVASQGLPADDLLGLVIPRMPGQNLYIGMVAVLAAAIALTVRPSGRSYTLAGIGALGLLFALLSGPFLPSFASFVSFAGLFRYGQRYTFVMVIPVAALGAESMAALASLEATDLRQRAARWLAVAGTAAAIVLGTGIVTSAKGALHDAYIYALFSWLVSAWVLRQLVTNEGPWRQRFLALAAVLLVVDLWFAHTPEIEQGFAARPVTVNDAEVKSLPDVPLGARIFDRERFKFRVGTRLHIRDFGGYEGDPLALRRYARVLDLAHEDPHTLGHANVAFVTGVKGPRKMTLGRDFVLFRAETVRVPQVAPAVGWYPTARLAIDEPAAVAVLSSTRPGTIAILEEASLTPDELTVVRHLPGQGELVKGRFVEYGLGHLTAEVDAPVAGVVVVAEAYHPGWSATVDGRSARLLPANAALRGLLVGPGHHRIEMRFHIGLPGWLMLLSPLGMALALGLTRRRSWLPWLRSRLSSVRGHARTRAP